MGNAAPSFRAGLFISSVRRPIFCATSWSCTMLPCGPIPGTELRRTRGLNQEKNNLKKLLALFNNDLFEENENLKDKVKFYERYICFHYENDYWYRKGIIKSVIIKFCRIQTIALIWVQQNECYIINICVHSFCILYDKRGGANATIVNALVALPVKLAAKFYP